MALPHTEPATLAAAARGDAAAWDEVVSTWLPIVLAWCRRLGGRDLDAEDVAHDVFVQIFEDVAALRDPVAFPAWLYQIARGRVGKARAKAQRRERILRLFPFASSKDAVTRDVAAGEAALDLLQQLPDEQREVVVLCLVEDHTREEAAALLEVPVGTVKSRLRLGTQRFRALAEAAGLLDELEEVGRWT